VKKVVGIAPSLFAADAGRYNEEVASVEAAGASYLHIDVMDGHFVPNLSFGPVVVSGIRKSSRLLFDLHFMLQAPEPFVDAFIDAGADAVTVHAEADVDIDRFVRHCAERGIKAGLALRPMTRMAESAKYLAKLDILLVMGVDPGFGGQSLLPGTVAKVGEARRLRGELGASFLISVDGGVNESNSRVLREAGADILVAGSAVFGAADRKAATRKLLGDDE
jgi:ribulose-phosphate 3-epimerase